MTPKLKFAKLGNLGNIVSATVFISLHEISLMISNKNRRIRKKQQKEAYCNLFVLWFCTSLIRNVIYGKFLRENLLMERCLIPALKGVILLNLNLVVAKSSKVSDFFNFVYRINFSNIPKFNKEIAPKLFDNACF